jgi:hypothetical protein
MFDIERTDFGYRLTFSGKMDVSELEEWRAESERVLADSPDSFGVVIDMVDLKPLADEAQEVMIDGQHFFREQGMERSAVLVESAVTKMQFTRLAKESGIYDWERYVDTSSWDDPEAVALKWIQDEVEPDDVTADL